MKTGIALGGSAHLVNVSGVFSLSLIVNLYARENSIIRKSLQLQSYSSIFYSSHVEYEITI